MLHVATEAEWDAWQDVVNEFREQGVDLNNTALNPLVGAIRLWGERLVALEAGWSAGKRGDALASAEKFYTRVRSD